MPRDGILRSGLDDISDRPMAGLVLLPTGSSSGRDRSSENFSLKNDHVPISANDWVRHLICLPDVPGPTVMSSSEEVPGGA